MDSKTASQSSGLGMWTTPSLSGPMEHLNGLCQKIQFTVEMGENNQLPYLDVLVHRDKDTLTTSVYCKKTKTDQFMYMYGTQATTSNGVRHQTSTVRRTGTGGG